MKNAARYFPVGLAGLTSIVGLIGCCVRMVVVCSVILKQIQYEFSFAENQNHLLFESSSPVGEQTRSSAVPALVGDLSRF